MSDHKETRMMIAFDAQTKMAIRGLERSVARIAWVTLATFILPLIVIPLFMILIAVGQVSLMNQFDASTKEAIQHFEQSLREFETLRKK